MKKKHYIYTILTALLFSSCISQQNAETVNEAAPSVADMPLQQTPRKTAAGTARKLVPQVRPERPFVPAMPGVRISRVSVPGKYVALTFDDGPHVTQTPRILDILARNNAKATFFVLGSRAKSHPEILRRAVAQGCEIGSHTWNHINLNRSSWATIAGELDRTSAVIKSATGSAPRVLRPPYGAGSTAILSSIYKQYGTPSILWDVDTNDWRKPGVQTVINRAVQGARSGSIILVHDIHSSTADAVEGIVQGLQARGYTLVTVSELIAMGRKAASEAQAATAVTTHPTPSAGAASPSLAPAAPAATVEPVAPASPATTVDPVAPVAPTTPVAPLTPAQPVTPVVTAPASL